MTCVGLWGRNRNGGGSGSRKVEVNAMEAEHRARQDKEGIQHAEERAVRFIKGLDISKIDLKSGGKLYGWLNNTKNTGTEKVYIEFADTKLPENLYTSLIECYRESAADPLVDQKQQHEASK